MAQWIRFTIFAFLLLLGGSVCTVLASWVIVAVAKAAGPISHSNARPDWLGELAVERGFVAVETGRGWRRATIIGGNARVGDAGLPWLSMRAVKAPLNMPGLLPEMTPQSVTRQRGIELPARLQRHLPCPATSGLLPTVPIAPGFLYSTLFYSSVLLMPFVVAAARRHLRTGRGRCTKCNYDLVGIRGERQVALARCPECGKANPIVPSATSPECDHSGSAV